MYLVLVRTPSMLCCRVNIEEPVTEEIWRLDPLVFFLPKIYFAFQWTLRVLKLLKKLIVHTEDIWRFVSVSLYYQLIF